MYGVYDDYEKVMESRKYIASFKNKKFADFDSAKSWAEDTFADLQNCFSLEYDIDEMME